MKKSWLIIIVSLGFFVSCNDEKNLYEAPETPSEVVSKHVMTEGYEVPAPKEGYKTVVKLGDDVIYEGNIPLTIQVPKFKGGKTRSENLWSYEVEVPKDYGWCATYKEWGVLLFEDVINGDTDYNDFVCGVAHVVSLNGDNKGNYIFTRSDIRIKPMAMGNTIPMKFGIEYRKADGGLIQEIMITEDVRNHYFKNIQGFINTTDEGVLLDGIKDLPEVNEPTGQWFPVTVSSSGLYTLWFIETEGVRRYAANAGAHIALSKNLMNGESITNKGVPFGLFVPDNGLKGMPGGDEKLPWMPELYWPKELTSIYDAYPNFKPWTEGDKGVEPFSEYIEGTVFEKSQVNF